MREFRRYLINQKIDQAQRIEHDNNRFKKKRQQQQQQQNVTAYEGNIGWIERLLQLPISDYRKHAVSLILSPYLVNIKKLQYKQAFDILSKWLSQCNSSRELNFNPNYLIKVSLSTAINKGIPPMKLESLKNRNIELYNELLR